MMEGDKKFKFQYDNTLSSINLFSFGSSLVFKFQYDNTLRLELKF